MKTRLPLIFLLLAVLLVATPLQVFAAETTSSPAIRIMELKNPLVGNYPIHIYVYPGVYVSESEASSESHECGEVLRAIHDAIQDLHHVITRFIDEHPEYYQLILIRFTNASDETAADITIKIFIRFGPESANASGYILYGENRPLRIGLLCNANITYNGYYTTFMHELFHALGVDHAKQPFTDGGEWDLMSPAGPLDIKIYPSTLDLYALYLVHFKGVIGGVVTLPDGMKYEMVTPYAKEMQSLRQENEGLKDQINTLNVFFDRVRRDRDALLDKLKQANATIQSQRQQLDSLGNDIIMVKQALSDHDVKLANVSQELAAAERFMLNKSAETDYKFRVVAMILQETWLTLQGLQNETASQAGRIAAAERGVTSLNLLFILMLCFMAAVLAAFIYLARRLAALESRVLRGESCLESGGESG